MRRLLLFTLPALVLISILLPDSSRSTSSLEIDPGSGQEYMEVFSAGGSNSVIYINWLEQATNDFSREPWFLGAYRFFNDGSLVTELKRGGVLTNNLRYALSYAAGTGAESAIYLSLLTTNGVVLAASEDLLTSSNVDHYVISAPMEIGVNSSGIQSNATILLVNVPTAEYPDAAVIQLIAADNGTVPIIVEKSALYIDEDGDFCTQTAELRNETSDYIFNATGGSVSNFTDWVNGSGGGSSTNNPGGGGSGGDGSGGNDDDTQQSSGIIFIDQVIGDDSFNGFSPVIADRGQGPKKTISNGLAAVEQDGAHTLVIKSGNYGEDLDLRGRNLTVVIKGRVRL